MTTALKVAARFLVAAKWDGKFLGKDARLRWDRHTWRLEELTPPKGKKKVRVATMQNIAGHGGQERYWNAMIPFNILREAKLSRSDSYDAIKKKIGKAMEDAAKEIEAAMDPKPSRSWVVASSQWREEQMSYLKIEPEGVDPFEAEGKDFKVNLSWTSFSAYSPKSDLESHDPSYTKYESSSAAAARKMYKMLRADEKALKNVSWPQFSDWLNKNKIGYKTHFSSWR